MRGVSLVALAVALSAGSAFSQQGTITVGQAESLVRAVLRHERLRLSSRYCELEPVHKDGKAFVPDYYSFSAYCDYPNAGATTILGLYIVSPRTGEVWEYNECKPFTFPRLLELRRKMVRQTHETEQAEAKYRINIGCANTK
jgi:hypothetical protein